MDSVWHTLHRCNVYTFTRQYTHHINDHFCLCLCVYTLYIQLYTQSYYILYTHRIYVHIFHGFPLALLCSRIWSVLLFKPRQTWSPWWHSFHRRRSVRTLLANFRRPLCRGSNLSLLILQIYGTWKSMEKRTCLRSPTPSHSAIEAKMWLVATQCQTSNYSSLLFVPIRSFLRTIPHSCAA